MKIPRKVCWILTLGHWWKHYPGEKRYVRCRLCGQMPKSMWDKFLNIQGFKFQKAMKQAAIAEAKFNRKFLSLWK